MTDKQIINSCEFQSRCIQYKDMYSNKHIKCPIVDFALACRGENKCKYKTVYEQLKAKEQECEELKKEIINKNEKIKELRFSVSDLTNRLCYLNAEKSFRIVDLEQTLDEIEKELKERLVRTEEDLKYQCVDCMNVKSDRYRKALEEIEGLVKNFCKDCGDYENCNWDKEGCYYSLIPNLKDIINKAKGEINE